MTWSWSAAGWLMLGGAALDRERKATEGLEMALAREQAAAEHLRGLDELKSAFVQAVSHDLRTPLASVLGIAVTLEKSRRALPPEVGHAPGSGVGLALVARFADLHGGRAWVEPRAGGGACFQVLLPDAPDAAHPPDWRPTSPQKVG